MQGVIQATSIGGNAGPFTITDNLGNNIASNITRQQILDGYSATINDSASSVNLISSGTCTNTTIIPIPGAIYYNYNGLTLESSTTPFCEDVMKNRQLTIRRFTITITDINCNPITGHSGYTFQVSKTSVNNGTDYELITINSGSSSNYITYVSLDACDTNNNETVTITNSDGLTQCSL